MDRIDLGEPAPSGRRDRFFARSAGTRFAAAATSTDMTTIDLYDEIGFWGVTAKDFRSQLRDAAENIVLRINSPGGDVFDGIAIYNDLAAHKGSVRVEITGLAASIATIIAMAGDERLIAENAFFMIHDAWALSAGNRHDHAETSAILAKIDDAMGRTYAAKAKLGVRAISKMMDDETWMTGKEAVDQGFATGTLAATDAKAKFDVSVYAGAPQALRWPDEAFGQVGTEEDVEKLLMRDAGRTRSQARALIRDIRAGKTSKTEAKPGAGKSGLVDVLADIRSARRLINPTA
ncbi:MAG: Clp protease ClpP [Devosia sp.]|nr:Clp protease ClpP [Devosia sp.]